VVRTPRKKLDNQTAAVLAYLDEMAPGAMLVDGHENAIIGLLESFDTTQPIVVYDKGQILLNLMKDMSETDARELFDFNILGAYVGEQTPVFVEPLWRLVRPVPATRRGKP
jgi:hypothetical protein